MPTRLSRFAEGVMEAVWLAAIILTPLFFNKYSSRIFEPDKATLLRTLALITVLAWIIKWVDGAFASRNSEKPWRNWKSTLRAPFAIPVLLLAVSYLIATALSVTPRISFWGSYQRLQGMYTTFSYIVLFVSIATNLKTKKQVERIITTAILVSLPVSLYGVLQKYGIDPIPWGGDVTRRVASHMGNPIFVAAFLILVFPLTVARIIDSFKKILHESANLTNQTARATIYIFIGAIQLIAIYFTQSRGPWLGLFISSFMIAILFSLHWQKRWLSFSILGVAILAGTFLIMLNIPNSPIEALKTNPSFYRLSKLLDRESNTAKVRSLIWGGSYEMVTPHEPLEFPDGSFDSFNVLRTFIGYGPESMHMAYNPFYPPELAYVEKRNASPDRSHNETWDSMVFSGLLGLAAYLSVFTSIFYYGLKWLGVIETQFKRWLFFGIYFGSGIISSVVFINWQGIAFAGLGLPFGLILGLIFYLMITAITPQSTPKVEYSEARAITIIMLLAAVVAHFAEINFGISIVSTRTYFFIYGAVLLVVGHRLPQMGEYNPNGSVDAHPAPQRFKHKGKRVKKPAQSANSWIKPASIYGGIAALLLIPMSYEYVSNLWGMTSANQILWTSLTQVEEGVTSYGVLALVFTTWISAGVLFTAEIYENTPDTPWWKTFGSLMAISAGVSFFYTLILSGSLAALARMAPQNIDDIIQQTAGLEGLLTQFYGVLIFLLLALGSLLPDQWPQKSKNESIIPVFVAVIGFILTIWLSVTTNWRIIHADIAFKMAEPFANSKQWVVANRLYRRAIEFSPDEDYYYLFLGRGSLEEAKTLTDPAQKEQAFLTAEADLLQAQKINPLNPDHTANLGRLHSWWALQTTDEAERIERGQVSDYYFSRVTVLSPNNARLWDEWAILNLNVLNDHNQAIDLLNHSLEIDPQYDWTLAILGDIYSQLGQQASDEIERKDNLEKAVEYYNRAITNVKTNLNYYFALAAAYQSLGNNLAVIDTLETSLAFANDSNTWQIQENLAHFYFQEGNLETALKYLQDAVNNAPESETERLQTTLDQLNP